MKNKKGKKPIKRATFNLIDSNKFKIVNGKLVSNEDVSSKKTNRKD